MQVRILGAHQGESRDTRFISMLIDGRLAIDAGGLTTTLTRDEQLQIEAVLITHRHYDHIKDLPGLAHTFWELKDMQLYCLPDTRDALQAHMFNGVVWPALRQREGIYHAVVFHDVEPGASFDLLGFQVTPVKVPHTVPAVGYCVSRDGKSVFYTADTRGTDDPPWAALRPDLVLVETTMVSSETEAAQRFGHMTARSLEVDLRAFHERQGYYPRTVCVHMTPRDEAQIREEISALAGRLGADIVPGYEGMVLDV